jgi:hypothetical protein
MEVIYNREKLRLYERRAQAGKKLAERAQRAKDKCRQTGETLKVVSFPQGGERVPSVRVAGKWLERFGFKLGVKVTLTATEGQILITRKEDEKHVSSLV